MGAYVLRLRTMGKSARESIRRGRPLAFTWVGAATVAGVVAQRGSLRAAEEYLRPARSSIRRWRRAVPAFAVLIECAQRFAECGKKAAKLEHEQPPGWRAFADELRDAEAEYAEVCCHVMRRVREEGEESKTPAFDREVTAFLEAAAKRHHVKP